MVNKIKKIYRKSFFCVVYKKKKGFSGKEKILYLILKRKLHWKGWEFPKGGLENKEDEKKAMIREVKEETGNKPLSIKAYSVSGQYKYKQVFFDRPEIIGQSFKLFSAELSPGKIKVDKHEHSTYKWVSFEKAYKILTWPNQKQCLRVVNKSLKKP
ncbi:MAG: NUDIX domain-containing protein [archaeon]